MYTLYMYKYIHLYMYKGDGWADSDAEPRPANMESDWGGGHPRHYRSQSQRAINAQNNAQLHLTQKTPCGFQVGQVMVGGFCGQAFSNTDTHFPVQIHTCTRVYTHTYIHIYILPVYKYIYTYIHICIDTYMHTSIYT